MTAADEVAVLLWMVLALVGIVGLLVGALYLRAMTLLDDTSQRLQDVAQSLSNHGIRLDHLERKT